MQTRHPFHPSSAKASWMGPLSALTLGLLFATPSGLSAAEVGTENIMRAVRSWSNPGTMLSDTALITHSATQKDGLGPVTRLPISGHDGLLSGEEAEANWTFHATAADLIAPMRLSLAFTNSATVLPETSRLEAYVNGVKLGRKALRYPDKVGLLEIDISPSHLKAGRNDLRIRAEQHHRVDCTLDGSYELWTALDLQRSTLSIAETPLRFSSLQDLAAYPRGYDQAISFNLVGTTPRASIGGASASEELLLLTQKTILATEAKSPAIRVVSDQSTAKSPDGIDLFVGSLSELIANDRMQRTYRLGDGAHLLADQRDNIAFVSDATGRRVLVAQLNELRHRPDGFAFLRDRVATSDQTQEDSSISLGELGYKEREYKAQRFSETISLSLPADFYPADYDSLNFHLFASHARGLHQAELQIMINGKSKFAIPISRQSDGVIEDHQIKMPLSAFKPGANEIEIVGLMDKGEAPGECATRLNRSRKPLFFLSSESYFTIPKLAHLPVLPDVRTTLQTGYPYQDEQGNGQIHVEIHDDFRRGLQVTADFVSRLAVNANRPFAVSLVGEQGLTTHSDQNRIIVGSYATIPAHYAKFQDGVDLNQLARQTKYAELPQAVDMLPTASIGTPASTHNDVAWSQPQGMPPRPQHQPNSLAYQEMPPIPAGLQDNLAQDSLREVFKRRAERERGGFHFSDLTVSLQAALSPISGAFADGVTNDVTSPLSGNNKVLISQKQVNGSVTTLVSYDRNATDYLGMDALFASTQKGGEALHTISLSGYGDSLTQLKNDGNRINATSLSQAHNLDLVFAGWLSNNPAFYALLTFFSLLGFGLASSVLLNRTKRSGGETFEQTF